MPTEVFGPEFVFNYTARAVLLPFTAFEDDGDTTRMVKLNQADNGERRKMDLKRQTLETTANQQSGV